MEYAQFDSFKAIAHPVRRNLIRHLHGGKLNMRALETEFEITRQALSKHLKILVDSNLVSSIKFGREVYYELQKDGLKEIEEWARKFGKDHYSHRR